MREAIVYWSYPKLEKTQKIRILKECPEEVEKVRRYLWNAGCKIFEKKRQEAYEKLPWIVKKMNEFDAYFNKQPSSRAWGITLIISGIALFLFQTTSLISILSIVTGTGLIFISYGSSNLR